MQSEGAALSHASDFDPPCFEAEFDIMVFAFARQYIVTVDIHPSWG